MVTVLIILNCVDQFELEPALCPIVWNDSEDMLDTWGLCGYLLVCVIRTASRGDRNNQFP